MSTRKVVVTGRIPEPALDNLRADQSVDLHVWDSETAIPRDDLLELVRGAHGIVTLLTERVDAELVESAGPQLAVVSNVAVGYNNLDVPAIHARGVIATNTPGVLTDATADIALALILMVTRRLGEGERAIRSGKPWAWSMFYNLGMGITGRRLGIVGMGAIGQALAVRARACGMTISYANRSRVAPDIEAALGAEFVSFDELLATSDVVSLNCPYTPETHHLMNATSIAQMQPRAFLINTARGPIVDEAALVNALAARTIAGAGLDVFEHEPQVHPGLMDRDDVVLLPHLGSATLETRTAMGTLATRNCLAVMNGEAALTPIR